MKVGCPYCKKQIGSEEICPHCSRNLNKPIFSSLIVSIICFLIGLFIYISSNNCEPSGEGLNCLSYGLLVPILAFPLFFISIICLIIFVCNFIAFKRKKKGLTQEQLAEKLVIEFISHTFNDFFFYYFIFIFDII